MAVALLALLVSLGGTAAAGTSLITGAQIKNHSIGTIDLSGAAVRALHGSRGPAGQRGLAGATGAAGASGGFDPAKVSYVPSAIVDIAPNAVVEMTATCPAGSKAIGGGGFAGVAEMGYSAPSADGTSWQVIAANNTGTTATKSWAIAVCGAP